MLHPGIPVAILMLSEDTAICKECSGKGKPVSEITVKSLVKEPVLEAIESLDGFFYCETPTSGSFTSIISNRPICIKKT